MKRRIIKELEALGIRYAEKPGVGRVKLSHLRTADLANLLEKVRAGLTKE